MMRPCSRFPTGDSLDLSSLPPLPPSPSSPAPLRPIVEDPPFDPLYDVSDEEKEVPRADRGSDTVSSRVISSTAGSVPVGDLATPLGDAGNAPAASVNTLSALSEEPLVRAEIPVSSAAAPSEDGSVTAFDVLKDSWKTQCTCGSSFPGIVPPCPTNLPQRAIRIPCPKMLSGLTKCAIIGINYSLRNSVASDIDPFPSFRTRSSSAMELRTTSKPSTGRPFSPVTINHQR